MERSYNFWLVGLSIAIALLTSYAALDSSLRARGGVSSTHRYHWGFISAFSMGIGIWVMHFIGMLALELPIPVHYNIPVTIASQIAAVSGAWLALTLISTGDGAGRLSAWRAVLGGLCMAAGIVAMHYLGMSAMNMAPAIAYDYRLVALSAGVATAAAILAMFAIRQIQAGERGIGVRGKLTAAAALGASMVAMHYIGIEAAHFAVGSYCVTSPLSFGYAGMAGTVGVFSLLLLAIVIVMAALNADGHASRFGLVLISVASALPLLLLLMLHVFLNYQNNADKAVAHAVSQAQSVANAVDGDLGRVVSALDVLATSPHLAQRDIAAFRRQAAKTLSAMEVDNLYLVDAAGRPLMNLDQSSDGSLPSLPESDWREQVFVRRRAAISDLVVDPARDKAVVTVMVPVMQDDKAIYALGAVVDPHRLSALLIHQSLPAERVVAIYDNTGRFIARNWYIDRWLGKPGSPGMLAAIRAEGEGSVEVRTVDGVTVVGVFARSKISGWAVAIGIPKESLVADLWSSIWMLIAYALFFVTISLYMAWLLGRRIVASIESLIQPALALGKQQPVSVPPLYLKELDKVGRALEEASRLLRKTSHEANHDALTGLPNRGLFAQVVRQQISLCLRSGTQMAVLFIDLDGFKAINDTYGHAIGDLLLKAVAARLQVSLRKADLAARLGGDEFAALLVNTDREGAAFVAEKLVESLSVPYPIGPRQLTVSASIGVSLTAGGSEDSVDALLNKSDAAMYQAKTAGKRRYVLAAS